MSSGLNNLELIARADCQFSKILSISKCFNQRKQMGTKPNF